MVPNQEQFRAPLPPAAGGSRSGSEHPAGGGGGGGSSSGLIKISALKDELQIMQKAKKLTFVGSDGLDYSFLAKPKDDLRKDYRLMDFAGLLNALLLATLHLGAAAYASAPTLWWRSRGLRHPAVGGRPHAVQGGLEDLYISERVFNKR
ncbi:hypothetical protein HYH02_015336, partial [Chlamydomonas schloesseri]